MAMAINRLFRAILGIAGVAAAISLGAMISCASPFRRTRKRG